MQPRRASEPGPPQSQKKTQAQGNPNRRTKRSSNRGAKSRQPSQSQQMQHKPLVSKQKANGDFAELFESAIVSDEDAKSPEITTHNETFLQHLQHFSLYSKSMGDASTPRVSDNGVGRLFKLCLYADKGVSASDKLPSCCFKAMNDSGRVGTQNFQIVQITGLGLRLRELMISQVSD